MIPSRLAAATSAVLMSSSTAFASYPCPVVKIITPFGAGQTFAVSEAVRDQLQDILGTTVIVEPRPGAGGAIGTGAVVKAAADGCTILFGASSSLILPFAKNKPYNALTDLRPVAFTIEAGPPVLLAPSHFEGGLDTLIAKARATPRGINVGTNNRTLAHLAALQLFSLAGVKITHVPYQSESDALNQLLGGHIDFVVVLAPTALGVMQSGKARALVQITARRNRFLPTIPSAADLGYEGADFTVLNSIFVPKSTPDALVRTLGDAIERAKNNPAFIKRMAAQASVPAHGGPAEVSAWLEKTTAAWARIVDDHGIERQ